MCGIAGFNWHDEVLLREMATAISHRGPEVTGSFCRGERVSFAHTRLSILDLHDRANQPLLFAHKGKEYVLVFNGEIYNYREVRRDLERVGCQFSTEGDSEVVAAAYAVWGEACVRRFNGMWAFAIFDDSAASLFLSRDRFGKKPLYYYNADGGRFLFASEIKALIKSAVVGRHANPELVSDLLNFGLAGHTDGTFFRGVLQLPAGSNGVLQLNTGQWSVTRYYAVPRDTNRADASDIRRALRTAVERRLVSDVPVCLSLSGGVDSSSIAAMVAEIHTDRMVAFTTTSDEGAGDETANVAKLLSFYPQFELIRVPIGAVNIQDSVERIVHHMDEPFIQDSPFVRWKIAEAIHAHGFKVSLTGEGADELLGGYPVASHLFLADLWKRRNFTRLAFELAFTLRQPDWRPVLGRFVSRFIRSREKLLERHFLENARLLGSRLPPSDQGGLQEGDVSLKEKLHSQVTTFFLPYLLACNDKMYMAHAVEGRAPFLDVELAELLLGIATERLIVRGIRKYPLRDAMRGRVPESVLFDRRKIGFASTIRQQMATPAARTWVRDLFADARSAAFVDSKRLMSAYERVGAGGAVNDFMLHAIALEVWMRQFDVEAG
jgi:asparagine synthase (glutamine-hydrolysing)